MNKHWSFIKNAVHSPGLVSYGLTRIVFILWIAIESLNLFDLRQWFSVDSQHIEARVLSRPKLNGCLIRGCEISKF